MSEDPSESDDEGAPDGDSPSAGDSEDPQSNVGQQFDRLPETGEERLVPGRAAREEVVNWWHDRFGVPKTVFDGYSFWEKGAGKIWIYNGEAPDPAKIEALGMTFLRTRQEHWKPTTRAVQRFGHHATTEVIELSGEAASRFARGEDQELEWDGDWGYLVVAHELAGERVPIGVGLYVYGELRSVIPKGSQENLGVLE